MNNRKQSLAAVQAADFAVIETKLFLDTHPDCGEALEALSGYEAQAAQARAEYERMYGPLTCRYTPVRWEWIDDPWPWEFSAN